MNFNLRAYAIEALSEIFSYDPKNIKEILNRIVNRNYDYKLRKKALLVLIEKISWKPKIFNDMVLCFELGFSKLVHESGWLPKESKEIEILINIGFYSIVDKALRTYKEKTFQIDSIKDYCNYANKLYYIKNLSLHPFEIRKMCSYYQLLDGGINPSKQTSFTNWLLSYNTIIVPTILEAIRIYSDNNVGLVCLDCLRYYQKIKNVINYIVKELFEMVINRSFPSDNLTTMKLIKEIIIFLNKQFKNDLVEEKIKSRMVDFNGTKVYGGFIAHYYDEYREYTGLLFYIK